MQESALIPVFTSPAREPCVEYSIVLAAQGIETQVGWSGAGWTLSVPPAAESAARYEIAAYTAEARIVSAGGKAPVLSRPGNPWAGVAVYIMVLVCVAVLAAAMGLDQDWLARGRMDGARLLAGEWWRTVTALTLHADAGHILGNIVFGSFFGYTVARYMGNGFGWLAIVVSGALGNLLNGLLSGADHRSIGASTAVFAALGVLSAYYWKRGFPVVATRRERLAPVVAGIGLLAFTGTGGENTDLGAHLFGFMAGFGAGLVIAYVGAPEGRRNQWLAGGLALGLIAVSWTAALI